jgi:probable HAF family extracellular repeat protein
VWPGVVYVAADNMPMTCSTGVIRPARARVEVGRVAFRHRRGRGRTVPPFRPARQLLCIDAQCGRPFALVVIWMAQPIVTASSNSGDLVMRKFLLGASALVGVALLNMAAAEAATYVPIAPPSGAVTVLPFGINDSNIIAGGYTDSAGVLHGFYGPPDGSNYTVFEMKDGSQPEARAIRNDGSITGLALASGFTFGEEFHRSRLGTIKLIKNPDGNVQDGVAQGGNDAGVYVGDYLDTDGVTRLGFKGKGAKFLSGFKLPKTRGVTSTNPRQINNNGVVAGGYIGSDGIQHGFVRHGKKVTSFDAPGAVGVTTAEGINDAGQVAGLYTDSAGNRHAFEYDVSTGNFTSIDPGNGSAAQEAWGINNAGLIVGDTDSGTFPFIYCPLRKKQCPKGASAATMVHPANTHAPSRMVNMP